MKRLPLKRKGIIQRVPFKPDRIKALERRVGLKRTAMKKTARNRNREVKWARAVKERDAYTCQRCGKFNPNVHAHHIATRKRRPDLRYVIENGVSLDFACHRWVHDHPREATAIGLLSDEAYEKREAA